VALWRTRRLLAGSPYDYIVFYSPSIFFGPLVKRLKRRWSARAYLILRDIFPDWAVDAGIMKKGLAYRIFKYFERSQYEAADVIGVETSRSFEYFRGTRFESRTELLRNWTTGTKPPPCAHSAREKLGLEGKVVFFYGGNLGVAQDMDNLLRLARRMADRPDVHFLVVGEGSERRRLAEAVAQEHMSNVTILGPVDPSAYMSMLSEFDVGVITLDRRLKTFSNTGKLLGYLRCGLPVLASYNPGNDLEDLLRESGAGFGSVNGDDDLFYEHARRLCDAKTRRGMGANATKLLHEHFSVKETAMQILRHADRSLP
jgi:glycosyltransferase involved in cell wall biosynthesis